MRKSFVETNISLRANGQSITKRCKLLNKKGTFKSSEQCNTCKFTGYVLKGIGRNYRETTCDRDGETWRECSGSTLKTCKFYKQEDKNGNL